MGFPRARTNDPAPPRPRDRGWIVLTVIAAVLVACIGQAYVREWMQ